MSEADPTPPPFQVKHRDDEGAVTRVDETGVVPRLLDPARLVQHGHAAAAHVRQAPARARVREQVEEVPCVGGDERPAEAPDERAAGAGGEVQRALETGHVPGGRGLADEGRAAEDLERDRRAREPVLLDDVAAVHVAVGQAERPHHRVHPGRASGGRAADRLEQLVRRAVVRVDEHLPQEAREPRAGRGNPAQAAQELDRDRELQRRGGRKAGARVPGCSRAGSQVLDEDAADAREAAARGRAPLRARAGSSYPRSGGIGPRTARPPAAARTPARRASRSGARRRRPRSPAR